MFTLYPQIFSDVQFRVCEDHFKSFNLLSTITVTMTVIIRGVCGDIFSEVLKLAHATITAYVFPFSKFTT